MSSKNATGTQVDQNREDEDGQLAHQATPRAVGHEADNLGSLSLDVAGEPYTVRLFKAVQAECIYKGVPVPTATQIGAVLRGMADHTGVMAMTRYDFRELSPNSHKRTDFYPTETSVGRFIRDAAYAFYDIDDEVTT